MILLKRIYGILIYSNVFIAFCALALVLANQLTVEGSMHLNANSLFVFFSTLFTYSYLKFRAADAGKEETEHGLWYKSNEQLSKNILLISLLCTVALFFMLSTTVMMVVVVLALVTALYGFSPIPFTQPQRQLRDFGLLKTLFVALVWSVSTVVVPLADTGLDTEMMVFLLLRRFLFVLALTMVFEIKDLKHDEASNLQTLPMRIGVSNTKLLAQLILFALMVVNLLQYFFFSISLENMIAVNLSLLITVFCIQPLKEETPPLWYFATIDGMMILQFILVYIAVKFFEA